MKVLVTGSSGLIGSHLVKELLRFGDEVIGVDDGSKYGPLAFPAYSHSRCRFVEADVSEPGLLRELAGECDEIVAAAARIGGERWLRERPYEVMQANERITLAILDAALSARRAGRLRKLTLLSSSLVYEESGETPTFEGAERRCPPPRSAYGLQKLLAEGLVRAARAEHGLPYTILRPFNVLGTLDVPLSNARAARLAEGLTHLVPDLVRKLLAGQDPLQLIGDGRQLRHFTWVGDLARGIRLCLHRPEAIDQEFNLSAANGYTVRTVAEGVWKRLRPGEPFRCVLGESPPGAVLSLVPSVDKAARLLGFRPETSLDEMLDRVVPWFVQVLGQGRA